MSIFVGGFVALHKITFLFLISFITTSCSSTHKAYLETIKLAFESSPDPSLSLVEIQNSPVDLLYVRFGDRPRAVLALAYIENAQYKWVSADNEMLIEKAGRIIKTVGTKDNISFIGDIESDPLNNVLDIDNVPAWNRVLDYGKDYTSAYIDSTFELTNEADLLIDNKSAKAKLIKETVTFTSKIGDKSSWVNLYWFDIKTNQLLKSTQQITPNSEKYNLTYVSRIARLPISSILSTEG